MLDGVLIGLGPRGAKEDCMGTPGDEDSHHHGRRFSITSSTAIVINSGSIFDRTAWRTKEMTRTPTTAPQNDAQYSGPFPCDQSCMSTGFHGVCIIRGWASFSGAGCGLYRGCWKRLLLAAITCGPGRMAIAGSTTCPLPG